VKKLKLNPPIIFLATHGADIHKECCDLLRSVGYQLNGIGHQAVEETDELVCFPNK
jgi:hypothetical protein